MNEKLERTNTAIVLVAIVIVVSLNSLKLN